MERLTIDEVSKIIGDSPHEIRYKCRNKMYDPPICRIVRKKGGKQNRYQFYRNMVEKYVGIEREEIPVPKLRKKA